MSQLESQADSRPIRFVHTIPILRIFDIASAKAFYVEFLGFSVDWEHRFEPTLPLYTQVSRGDLTLHLTEHHGDCTPGSTVFVIMNGLHEFHREIRAKKYPYLRPRIERMPWNADVMEVTDPFGNRIRFNEYIRVNKDHELQTLKPSKVVTNKSAKEKPSRSRV